MYAHLEAESDGVEVNVGSVVQVAEALAVRVHADILPLQQRALHILPPATASFILIVLYTNECLESLREVLSCTITEKAPTKRGLLQDWIVKLPLKK